MAAAKYTRAPRTRARPLPRVGTATESRRLCASGRSAPSPGREVDKLTYHSALLHPGKTVVDLGQLDMAGDHVVQLQLALLVEFQQARHVDTEPVAAHRGTLD